MTVEEAKERLESRLSEFYNRQHGHNKHGHKLTESELNEEALLTVVLHRREIENSS